MLFKTTRIIAGKNYKHYSPFAQRYQLPSFNIIIMRNILGTPPPPANLTHTGVTETRIDLSWDKPIGYELFVIDGYNATYKTLSGKENKTKEIDPTLNNFAIQGLESETFYQITVHGYNSEGIGDKEEIQVKTAKSDEECKYLNFSRHY